ncbi:MAG: ATP-binding cassette, subfamily multidrug efflux pump [Eubacteriaceae bacterium]|nr:ATP-binding cassette, subfamily multidrug efflux pump [Eubacteriaceae bacterium]MDK2937084.1 ATP-binding cassette, subfamily multidrug efflux pump [Eubacteriaceae bacterium]
MKQIINTYLSPHYKRMSVGIFFKFTGSLMDLLIPYILAHIIDQVIPLKDQSLIFIWGSLMILVSAFGFIFNIIANRLAAMVGRDTTKGLRHDLFKKILALSSQQVDELTRASIISRLTSDTYNIHIMITRVQRLGIRAPMMIFGGIIITMMMDPVLAAILVATMPIMLFFMVRITRKSIPLFSKLQKTSDHFVRIVREDISGIRVIKALSKTQHEKLRFDEINKSIYNQEKKARRNIAALKPLLNICMNLGLVALIVVGAYLVNNGRSEVGKILAFMTYFTIILNALMAITRLFEMITRASASASRITAVLNLEETHRLKDNHSETNATAIQFSQVFFSYNKNENNLEDLSFAVQKGQTLGIIGETGAGKTTLVNLLLRFYDVDRGTIRIDGQSIDSIAKKELYQKFGVVFQNNMIFEDSIEANVKFGRDISEADYERAIRCAGAKEFIEKKSDDEKLKIRGANLSGGQKQRLLIARALAGNPEILILDDASSALDYQTDANFRKALKSEYCQTTKIIIAQRISSVMSADHILVLEDGRKIAWGNHEELMRTCLLYREISASQMGVS